MSDEWIVYSQSEWVFSTRLHAPKHHPYIWNPQGKKKKTKYNRSYISFPSLNPSLFLFQFSFSTYVNLLFFPISYPFISSHLISYSSVYLTPSPQEAFVPSFNHYTVDRLQHKWYEVEGEREGGCYTDQSLFPSLPFPKPFPSPPTTKKKRQTIDSTKTKE